MATLDDLLRFVANPPPGDPSLTAGSDQIPPSVLQGAQLASAPVTGPPATIQLNTPLTDVAAGCYIGVDVGNTLCEIATVSAVAGTTITLKNPGLALTHAAGAPVRMVFDSNVPAWWFGVVGDLVHDDTAAWQAATTSGCVSRSLTIDGQKRNSKIFGPIMAASECRIKNATFTPDATFTPADFNNSVLAFNTGPVTPSVAAGGAISTNPVAHGMVVGTAFMIKNSTGAAGYVDGRNYYCMNVTTVNGAGQALSTTPAPLIVTNSAAASPNGGHFTITGSGLGTLAYTGVSGNTLLNVTTTGASGTPANGATVTHTDTCAVAGTVLEAVNNALGQGGAPSVIPTAGAGTCYTQTLTLGRLYTDDVYINCNRISGVNGIMLNVQQPGYSTKLRVDSAANLGPPAAPTLATAPTGGNILGGSTFTVGITYYNARGVPIASTAPANPMQGETAVATNTIVVPAGTNTNTITVTSPAAAGSGPMAATSYVVYMALIGGTTSPLLRLSAGPTPLGNNLVITSTGQFGTVVAPITDQGASCFGMWLAGQQYTFINFEGATSGSGSTGNSTGILAEGAKMMYFTGGFNIGQTPPGGACVRTQAGQTIINGGGGLTEWHCAGCHHEVSANTVVWDLSWSGENLEILSPWVTASGGTLGGAFIYAPNNAYGTGTGQASYRITNLTGTFSGSAGWFVINDALFGTRDGSSDYHQFPPSEITTATIPSAGGALVRSRDVLGGGGTSFMGGGIGYQRIAINDANYTVRQVDCVIGYTALTATRSVTLPQASTCPGTMIIIKNETSSVSTLAITPHAGDTIDGASGVTNVSTAHSVTRLLSTGGTNWDMI